MRNADTEVMLGWADAYKFIAIGLPLLSSIYLSYRFWLEGRKDEMILAGRADSHVRLYDRAKMRSRGETKFGLC